jgi:hypothetical protein
MTRRDMDLPRFRGWTNHRQANVDLGDAKRAAFQSEHFELGCEGQTLALGGQESLQNHFHPDESAMKELAVVHRRRT